MNINLNKQTTTATAGYSIKKYDKQIDAKNHPHKSSLCHLNL